MKNATRMLFFFGLILTTSQMPFLAQSADIKATAEIEDRDLILHMTAPIVVHFRDSVPNYGSAFYFQKYAAIDPTKGQYQLAKMQSLYLVTAKHLIDPARIGSLTSVTFYMRGTPTSGNSSIAFGITRWFPITLSPQEVRKRLHICPNPDADVAALDILDLILEGYSKLVLNDPNTGMHYPPIPFSPFWGVNEDYFPDKSMIDVNTGDDVVVIGYPRKFYDSFNKLPILKSGLLITPLGVRYDNMDAFLLDFKEYEGMSGGLVISKPTQLLNANGEFHILKKGRDFVFLGVYSGQRYKGKAATDGEKSADLGIGWYYYNVTAAIDAPPMFAAK